MPKDVQLRVREIDSVIDSKRRLRESKAFLLSKRADLRRFEDVEDFAFQTCEGCPISLQGVEHHLLNLRAELARQLWSRQIFIGVSVLDTLLFWAVKDDTVADPVTATLRRIRDFGLHRPAFVVYPLHSFGILGAGLFRFFTENETEFAVKPAGIVVSPQLNAKDEVVSFLKGAAEQLGVRKRIPVYLVEHYMRSRPLQWLTRNPLLVVRTQSFSGSYYENQALLCIHLFFATAHVFLLGSLTKHIDDDKAPTWSSTAKINNFQTLDIKHYLVFERPIRAWRKSLSLSCVPMNASRTELAELSDLNVEIDPREWRRTPLVAGRVQAAISKVETTYVRFCVGSGSNSTTANVMRKLHTSLMYFKRSFRSRSSEAESIVALAIAFEILVTDYYADNLKKRIARRVKLALRGVRGTTELQKAVADLFGARGAIVHGGYPPDEIDIRVGRRAYALAFLGLVEKLPADKVPKSEMPIADLLGDTSRYDEVAERKRFCASCLHTFSQKP